MIANKRWHVEIQVDEQEGKTRALARLHHREESGLVDLVGVGLARLNPADSDMPEIGDELAVARALSDLGSPASRRRGWRYRADDPPTGAPEPVTEGGASAVSEATSSSGRVVVGVDGSAGSLAALNFALDEAARRATGLLVVSAFELPELWSLTSGLPVSCTPEEIQHSVLDNTRRIVTEALGDRMTADGAPDVEVVARGGGAAHVLVSAAADSPLLVVGSRGRGGFRRMLLGSVSLTCVLPAPCPVTVVRSATDHDHAQIPELSGAPAAIR